MEENRLQIKAFDGRFDIDLNHPYAVFERESNKHLEVWFNADGKLYLVEDLKKLV